MNCHGNLRIVPDDGLRGSPEGLDAYIQIGTRSRGSCVQMITSRTLWPRHSANPDVGVATLHCGFVGFAWILAMAGARTLFTLTTERHHELARMKIDRFCGADSYY